MESAQNVSNRSIQDRNDAHELCLLVGKMDFLYRFSWRLLLLKVDSL